jgi:superfamily I DNA/RNA helicase
MEGQGPSLKKEEKMNLDFQQQAAVMTDSRQVLCLAGAGSGKTRVLVERIAHLIEHEKVSPYEIMAISFTRKASGELKKRLEERVGRTAHHITTGTIHAVALRYLKRFGELIGLRGKNLTVYSEFEENYLLRECAIDLGIYKGKAWKIPKREIDAVFDAYYQEGILPEEDHPCRPIFDEFISRCRENNSLTYGALLCGFKILLPLIKQYLNLRHIFVDECQDLDLLQWKIFNELRDLCGASLSVVGDIDQCQPAGTMVLTPYGEKPIEGLKDGDRVRAWSRRHGYVQEGGSDQGSSGIKKKKNLYSGILTRVGAGERVTSATDTHRWLVRWGESAHDLYAVYVMRKTLPDIGVCFRVGWCKVINEIVGGKYKVAHYKQRCRLEGADAIWLIKVTKKKSEASAWESIINTRYQIPTIMFKEKKTTPLYTKENLNFIWKESYLNSQNGFSSLLRDFELREDHPSWEGIKGERAGRETLFEVVSVNLQEGMEVPVWDGGRGYAWEPIHLSRCRVENLEVYSLDVDKHHSYVADGICTLNSIYSWRGAIPEYLIEHQAEFEIFKIENNYRSCPEIVGAANRLIEHNESRIPRTMKATREEKEGAGLIVYREMDSENVVRKISDLLEDHWADPSDIAILGRNHFLLKKIASMLDVINLPYTYIGRQFELIESPLFRTFHAFLKLLVNPFDNFSFLLIRELLGLSRREYNEIRLKATQGSKSHFQTWKDNEEGKQNPVADFFFAEFEGMSSVLTALLGGFDWPEEIKAVKEFVDNWAKENPPMVTVSDYLDWLATYDIQEEVKAEDDKLKLMTIHAAKGLEWPTVMMIGCNEGILPSKQSIEAEDVESERRLFYVAMTRAKDSLILAVRPERKEVGGKVYENPISRFVRETT